MYIVIRIDTTLSKDLLHQSSILRHGEDQHNPAFSHLSHLCVHGLCTVDENVFISLFGPLRVVVVFSNQTLY